VAKDSEGNRGGRDEDGWRGGEREREVRSRLPRLERPVGEQLDAELTHHFAEAVEALVAAGWTEAAARAEATRRFGDTARYRPELERIGRRRVRRMKVREVWDEMGQDFGYALRKMVREPAFFAFAALIMGLGVGAATAVYSVASPLLLRPLPFRDAERLVWISNTGSSAGLSSMTSRTSNLRDYRELNRSFEGLTGYFAFFEYVGNTLTGAGEPERVVGVGVARDFLDVLGVRLAHGRGFAPASTDPSAGGGAVSDAADGRPAMILTNGFWKRRFGGDPGVVGRVLTVNGAPTEVVGVLPETFDFASTFAPGSRIDYLTVLPIDDETDSWGNTIFMIGRLRSGATIESAQADLDAMNARLEEADESRWGLGGRVTSVRDQVAGRFRGALGLLAGASAMVLLIGCANLSNLLLSRGRRRSRELAVRSALGADRRRLLRQLVVENLVLSLGAAVIGIVLASLFVRSVADATALRIPLLAAVTIDAGALGFTLAVTVAAGLFAGLVPALHASRGREATALNDASRGSTEGRRGARVREALVVAEVALACCLLVGMGLLLRSFVKVLDVDLGFHPENAVMWELHTSRPFEDQAAAAAYFRDIVDRVSALTGVEGAGLTDAPPLGRNRSWTVGVEGVTYEPGQMPGVFPRVIDTGYLDAIGIPLRAGRAFAASDDGDSDPVVLLNETGARVLFGEQDPLGRTLFFFNTSWRVVGIVGDVRHQSLEEAAGSELYLALPQASASTLSLVVRSRLSPTALVPAVRAAIRAADPALATGEYRSVDAIVDRAVSPRRFILTLVGAFAAGALLLAMLGIYAVLSYSVSQRTPEIGIRMALGESAGEVRRALVSRTLVLAGTGIAIGAALTFALSRVIGSMLYGVAPADPIAFGGVAILLLGVAAAAGYLPARRASRTDPMTALRAV
jgi:putative ABC transport system permease protein